MKLVETKDNPYPVRVIEGYTVLQASQVLSFLINNQKIHRFEHSEGVLSESTIKKWIKKNDKN